MNTIPRYGGGNQWGTNVQFTQVKVPNQQREAISGTDGNTRADITCYNCQRSRHIRLFCPYGTNIQKNQVTLNQSEVLIHIIWVLFDSGYTVSSILNSDPIYNIRDENFTATFHTNGVSKDYTQTASLHLLSLDVNFNSTYL